MTKLKAKVTDSLAIGDLDMSDYDVVFLAGGWGAAFDFGFSEPLADKVTDANAKGLVIGGVCHGPLGLLNAKDVDGKPLVAGRKISAVTNKQVKELGISRRRTTLSGNSVGSGPSSKAKPVDAIRSRITGSLTAIW